MRWDSGLIATTLLILIPAGLGMPTYGANPGPDCVLQRINDLLDAPYVEIDEAELPESLALELKKADSKRFFKIGKSAWEEAFDRKKLIDLLSQVKSDPNSVSASKFLLLKAIRKRGLLMRNVYKTFDQTHRPPKELDDFVRDFGKLNDAANAGNPELMRKLSKQLVQRLRTQNLEKIFLGFKPASRASISNHLMKTLTKMNAIASSKGRISIVKFHELRKNLRELQTSLRFLSATSDYPEYKPVLDYIHALNFRTGLVHDAVVSRDEYHDLSVDLDTGIVYSKVGQPLTQSVDSNLRKSIQTAIEIMK